MLTSSDLIYLIDNSDKKDPCGTNQKSTATLIPELCSYNEEQIEKALLGETKIINKVREVLQESVKANNMSLIIISYIRTICMRNIFTFNSFSDNMFIREYSVEPFHTLMKYNDYLKFDDGIITTYSGGDMVKRIQWEKSIIDQPIFLLCNSLQFCIEMNNGRVISDKYNFDKLTITIGDLARLLCDFHYELTIKFSMSCFNRVRVLEVLSFPNNDDFILIIDFDLE